MTDLFLSLKNSGKLLHLYLVFKKSPTMAKGPRQRKDCCPVAEAMSATSVGPVAFVFLDKHMVFKSQVGATEGRVHFLTTNL